MQTEKEDNRFEAVLKPGRWYIRDLMRRGPLAKTLVKGDNGRALKFVKREDAQRIVDQMNRDGI